MYIVKVLGFISHLLLKVSKFLQFTWSFPPCSVVLQAYTSQFVSLVMFALMMCDDRISMQERRKEIMLGLKRLPGMYRLTGVYVCLSLCLSPLSFLFFLL